MEMTRENLTEQQEIIPCPNCGSCGQVMASVRRTKECPECEGDGEIPVPGPLEQPRVGFLAEEAKKVYLLTQAMQHEGQDTFEAVCEEEGVPALKWVWPHKRTLGKILLRMRQDLADRFVRAGFETWSVSPLAVFRHNFEYGREEYDFVQDGYLQRSAAHPFE